MIVLGIGGDLFANCKKVICTALREEETSEAVVYQVQRKLLAF